MEVTRQRCSACGSVQHEDLVVRQPGAPARVYVRCARCGKLVARYVLSSRYHHGEEASANLPGLGQLDTESGREALEELRREQEESEAEFRQVLEELGEQEG